MSTSNDPQSPQGSRGRLWRYWPLVAAGFVTGVLFGMVQQPDKTFVDWLFLAVGIVAAILLWTTGIRRYSRRD
ncbi:hypothetical protein [Arthrobacter castelli]|uniref:hypothetical protein n=1 Tax=Arthrobacter castelli TaxID=271431 RepID=UPI000415A6DF|nr:hypothetical protein [Arthrobacter castelli]